MSEWPPTYTLLRHSRAKRVRLRICPLKGLVITIPTRFKEKELPNILDQHRNWICKHLATTYKPFTLPEQITLLSLNESWQIRFAEVPGAKTRGMQLPDNTFTIIAAKIDPEKCHDILTTWIKGRAGVFLNQKLTEMSERIGIPFTKLCVRNQKTLWGSCSVDRNINLNYRLVFLPINLVEHVCIHELAHTIHQNHSPRFWNLVEKHDQASSQHRKELRKAKKYMPDWLDIIS